MVSRPRATVAHPWSIGRKWPLPQQMPSTHSLRQGRLDIPALEEPFPPVGKSGAAVQPGKIFAESKPGGRPLPVTTQRPRAGQTDGGAQDDSEDGDVIGTPDHRKEVRHKIHRREQVKE